MKVGYYLYSIVFNHLVWRQGSYTKSRNAFLTNMFAAAKASSAAAVLVWEIMPWHVANQSYDFRCSAYAPSRAMPDAQRFCSVYYQAAPNTHVQVEVPAYLHLHALPATSNYMSLPVCP